MSQENTSAVSFEFALGTARFRIEGPREWVDRHVGAMLSSEQFKVPAAGQALRAPSRRAEDSSLPPQLERWMDRHGISLDALTQVLHLGSEQCTVTAHELPGNGKQKVVAAYLLEGLAAFAVSETKRFQDKAARDLLNKHGAYDKNNHATYFREGLQGRLVGDKEEGFVLSVPGLNEAAALVKRLATAADADD